MRLDCYVSKKFNISRAYAKNLIKCGKILIGKERILDPSLKDYDKNLHLCNEKPSIKILYDCVDFIVVHKPYDMSVCRSISTPKVESVLNELVMRNHMLANSEKQWEFGLVHRLDKLTEGIILLAKNKTSYEDFKCLFRNQKIKKYYRAYYNEIYPQLDFRHFVCKHGMQHFTFEDQCFCEENFSHYEMNLLENETYKLCKTNLIKKNEYYLCSPITGRTHQIRQTLKNLGEPVWGDPIYGIRKKRMLLFATGIAF